MSIGVAIFHEDSALVEDVVDAIDRTEGMHLAGVNETSAAAVVLAGGRSLWKRERDSWGAAGLVVLSAGEQAADARAGFEAGARGWLRWPADAGDLGRLVAAASQASEHAAVAAGRLLAVAGARGGCGATLLSALLGSAVPSSIVVDLDFLGAGQRAFCDDGAAATSLQRVIASPMPEVVAGAAEAHASGKALLCRPQMEAPAQVVRAVLDAARAVAPLVVADIGRLDENTDAYGGELVVVLGDDLASCRAARAFLDAGGGATFVLNRFRPRGLRARHVRRALGRAPDAVVGPGRRFARALDVGRLPRVPRSLRGLAVR